MSSYKPIRTSGEIDLSLTQSAIKESLTPCNPEPKSMGANKGKTFELNYGKIHGSREYYMKVIVNPGSGAFLREN